MIRQGLLKEFSTILSFFLRIFDLLLIVAGGMLAYLYRFGSLDLSNRYQTSIIVGTLLAALILPIFGTYNSWRGKSLITQLWSATLAWFSISFILAISAFSVKGGADYSRIWAGLWMLYTWLLIITSRVAIRLVFNFFRKRGLNHRQIVVIGAGVLGQQIHQKLSGADWIGYDLINFWDDRKTLWGQKVADVPVISVEHGVELLLSGKRDVDEVWLALPLRAEKRMHEIITLLRNSTVTIRFIPDIFGFRLLNHSINEVAGIPILDISTTPMAGTNRVIKALEDRIIAVLILTLISPLMLVLSLGVKLSSPGPIFYRQERVGWNGKRFFMLKYRSMQIDAEKSGVQWGGANAKNITHFGRILRKTSLDELPQFINVLRGEMSIVGPRPERTMFVEQFKEEIPDYMKKHLMKAGITGWAQINGWRGDTDLTKRIEYDLFYIENWSLWFDLKIIFFTIFKGFIGKNVY